MKYFTTIIFIIIIHVGFSQTNGTKCAFPSTEILPLELRSCSNLTNYFKDYIDIEKDIIENRFVSISCKLFSNGEIKDFKAGYINSKNTNPNPELVKQINQIENWNLSKLREYEYYELRFNFIYSKTSNDLRTTLRWNFMNYFESDISSCNKIDLKGLKQGQWIRFSIDTTIQQWIAIETETIIDSNNISKNNSGIDTIIFKRINYIGYYKNDQKDSIWYIYDKEIKGRKSKEDTIRFGNLKFIAQFEKNRLKGKLKSYYPTGILKSEIEFKNGLANGKMDCYFEKGKLKYNGILISNNEFFRGTEYSKNGYKLKDRNFNYDQFIQEWADLKALYSILDEE